MSGSLRRGQGNYPRWRTPAWDDVTGKPTEFHPRHTIKIGIQLLTLLLTTRLLLTIMLGARLLEPSEFPPADHNHDGDYLKTETDPVPDHVKAITTDDINNWNAGGGGASTWDELTGKPSEFPQKAHNQDWSTIGYPLEYPPEAHSWASEVDGLELRLEAIEGSISSGGGFVDAPNDGQLYGGQSEAWAVVPAGGASS